MADLKFTYIRDVGPGMKNINIHFIVLEVGDPRRTKDGSDIRTVRVADKSGSINLAVWNELGTCLKGGDICRLLNGFVTVHRNALSINCGRMGELQKVGEFCMLFSELPFMSTPNPEFAKYSVEYQKYGSGNEGNGGGNGSTGISPALLAAKPVFRYDPNDPENKAMLARMADRREPPAPPAKPAPGK